MPDCECLVLMVCCFCKCICIREREGHLIHVECEKKNLSPNSVVGVLPADDLSNNHPPKDAKIGHMFPDGSSLSDDDLPF